MLVNKVFPVIHFKNEDGNDCIMVQDKRPPPDAVGYNLNVIEQMNKKNRIRARLQKKFLSK
jgi:hypothetical protein